MDKVRPISTNMENQKSKEVITREKFEDGSSIETRVEEVKGGWIITKEKYDGNEGWSTEKEVTTENPTLDKSSVGIADRLEKILKNIM